MSIDIRTSSKLSKFNFYRDRDRERKRRRSKSRDKDRDREQRKRERRERRERERGGDRLEYIKSDEGGEIRIKEEPMDGN